MSFKNFVVKFQDFDPERLVKNDPEKTAVVAKVPEKISKAYEILLRYKHKVESSDGKEISSEGNLTIEGPEMYSPSGVIYSSYEDEKDKPKSSRPSIFITFDMSNKENRDYVGSFSFKDGKIYSTGFLGKIYQWGCEQVFTYFTHQLRSPKSMETIMDAFPEKLVIMKRRYTVEDKVSDSLIGTLIPDANPVKFIKMRSYGIPGTPGYNESKMISPSGKIIPLSQLAGLKFKFIPHILWRRIWLGQQKGFTHEIVGGIITEIIESAAISRDLEKARISILNRNPDLASKIDEMLSSPKDKESEDKDVTVLPKVKEFSDDNESFRNKLKSLQGLGS